MLVCLPNAYAAEKFPQQAITVYHPFEPTPYDVLSEVYNEELSKILNVPVKFEYGMRGKAADAARRLDRFLCGNGSHGFNAKYDSSGI